MPPDLRVGDRERAAAAERLSAHHAAGRLSVDELERRLERAGAAVFAHDLHAVEADLPPAAARVPRAWPWLPFAHGLYAVEADLRPATARVPRAWPWLPFAFALLALGVAASLAVGHPVAPLFLVAALVLWRRAACG
jgi:hypothetical protein